MKEIGSFIELELSQGREWYGQSSCIARLNSGRAAIWHAFRVTGASAIWIPYYQCDSVRQFLHRKHCLIKYYHQDINFNPVDLSPAEDEAVLLVNYFGVMSSQRMEDLAKPYRYVIVDNCQAFFCPPIPQALCVYSARKFIGVADGSYVIGQDVERFVEDYPQCYSSDTAGFLLKRIEYGCEGKGYESRMLNEDRIDREDIMKMSVLTQRMLDGTDYEFIRNKRIENYGIACDLFDSINRIHPSRYLDNITIPMVYPLVIEEEDLLRRLLKAKHFQGHWWKYITKELPETAFEHWLSRFIIPITIDQRYGKEDLLFLSSVIADQC